MRANMPDCLNALSRLSVALSTMGPPWNCGPTDAQYLLASPCDCGHSMKRRCTGISVRLVRLRVRVRARVRARAKVRVRV